MSSYSLAQQWHRQRAEYEAEVRARISLTDAQLAAQVQRAIYEAELMGLTVAMEYDDDAERERIVVLRKFAG